VVTPLSATKVPPNAEVKDEVLDRKHEVPEPRFHPRPRITRVSGPATQRRFHAEEHVIDWPLWLKIWQENIALCFRQRFHSPLERVIRGTEALTGSHGFELSK
jgi:hypothetical protein